MLPAKAHNYRVTKSNKLIGASYQLGLEEQRLLLMSISQIDSRKKIPDQIKIFAVDYADTFDLDKRSAYGQLKTATDSLFEREIRIKDPSKKGAYKRMRWVTEAIYHKNEGYVSISFSNKIAPLLSQLGSEFTTYRLRSIAKLRSLYSIRIYEMIMQFKKTGGRVMTVDGFREALQLGTSYRMFADLRKRVITPAIKELNLNTEYDFTWEPIKEGRKYVALSFTIKQSQQSQFNFNEN